MTNPLFDQGIDIVDRLRNAAADYRQQADSYRASASDTRSTLKAQEAKAKDLDAAADAIDGDLADIIKGRKRRGVEVPEPTPEVEAEPSDAAVDSTFINVSPDDVILAKP